MSNKVRISQLPIVNRATTNDYFILNDEDMTTTHISWASVLDTFTSTNLTFKGSVNFTSNTHLTGELFFSQENLQKWPGIAISQLSIDYWNEAWNWGNHADAGYLDGSFVVEQSDFAETNTTLSTYIKNKPLIVYNNFNEIDNVSVDLDYAAGALFGTVINNKGANARITTVTDVSAGLMTPAQKLDLEALTNSTNNNIQSDWNDRGAGTDAEILNQPEIVFDSTDTSTYANGSIKNVIIDLEYEASKDVGTLTAGDGSSVEIPLVNTKTSESGLISASDKELIDSLPINSSTGDFEINYNDISGAPNIELDAGGNIITNVVPSDLGYVADPSNGMVTTSTSGISGTGAVIPAVKAAVPGVSTGNAGLMTPGDKSKLDNLPSDAEANLDLSQTYVEGTSEGQVKITYGGVDTTSTIPLAGGGTQVNGVADNAGLMSAADKTKLDSVTEDANENVQSDWSEDDVTLDSHILNRPTVPVNIDDLADVEFSSLATGEFLSFDGSKWVNTGLSGAIEYGGVVDATDATNVPNPKATAPTLYIQDNVSGQGAWTGIAGQDIEGGDRIFYDNILDTFYLFGGMGDIPSADLSYTANTESDGSVSGTGDINISTGGNSATIPAASASVAGLMHPDSWGKLNDIEAEAEKNVNPEAAWDDSTNTLTLTPGDDTTIIPVVTAAVDGLMVAADKTKLDGIASGAQVNVDTTATWDDSTNTLTLTPGNDDTIIPVVTTSADGLMSSTDKAKLDDVELNAEKNVNPAATWSTLTDTLTLTPGDDATVIPVATTSTNGLMKAADKAALDNLVNNPVTGNVQSDWDTIDVNDDSFIKNKPDLDIDKSLGELTDVTLTNEAKTEVLYRDVTGWVNKALDYSDITNTPAGDPTLSDFKIAYQEVSSDPNDSDAPKVGEVKLTHKVDGVEDTSETYIPLATSSSIGLMSAEDKEDLDKLVTDSSVGDHTFGYNKTKTGWKASLPYDFNELPALVTP